MNQHPFVRSLEFPWEALQESGTIAAPDLAVLLDQPSLQTFWISPLILRVMVQLLLGSTTIIMLPNSMYLLTQQYVQRCTCACCGTLSGFTLQYPLPMALAFGRGAVTKPSRGFPLQYRLLIALAFERGARAKLSKRFPLQYRLLIALAFERCTMTKLSRGFPLQYRLLIALAFDRCAGAKLSRGFPLSYRLLIALTFERGALAKLSRHNQAHRLSVKRLGRVDSQFVSPLESKSGLKTYWKDPPPDLYSKIHISMG